MTRNKDLLWNKTVVCNLILIYTYFLIILKCLYFQNKRQLMYWCVCVVGTFMASKLGCEWVKVWECVCYRVCVRVSLSVCVTEWKWKEIEVQWSLPVKLQTNPLTRHTVRKEGPKRIRPSWPILASVIQGAPVLTAVRGSKVTQQEWPWLAVQPRLGSTFPVHCPKQTSKQ